MDEQVLSIEQMQELIDMGVDTSNASCIWWNFADLGFAFMPLNDGRSSITIEKMKENHGAENIVPAFTLQDILKILPKPCYINCIDEDFYQCNYENTSTSGSTPLKAAFNMLKWCKENGYI